MQEQLVRSTYVFLVVSLAIYSSTAAVAQPMPPRPERERGRAMRPFNGNDTVDGVVEQYLFNPRGEADGLFLTDGTQIHFPPHMSTALVRAIKAADRINARGVRQGDRVFVAYEIINEKTKITVVDSGPRPGPPPRQHEISLRPMRAQAQVKALLYGPRGDVNGFLLCDQTIVRMPPETAFRFSNVFQPGQTMSVEGNGIETVLGKCIEATTIGTAGQPMISIYGDEASRAFMPRRRAP